MYSMYVAIMSFFAKISDPLVGGTYMTLLNTLCNLGGNWPSTLALWLVDPLSKKECLGDPTNDCSDHQQQLQCKEKSSCSTLVDGYYIESIVCVLFGLCWVWLWGRPTIKKLTSQSEFQWRVSPVKNQVKYK